MSHRARPTRTDPGCRQGNNGDGCTIQRGELDLAPLPSFMNKNDSTNVSACLWRLSRCKNSGLNYKWNSRLAIYSHCELAAHESLHTVKKDPNS